MAAIWISKVDLEELIGVDAALALLAVYPGQTIYIPHKHANKLGKFAPIIGEAASEILRNEFPGLEVVLPAVAVQRRTKKDHIIELLGQGRSYSEIVTEVGCTLRHVFGVARDSGLTPAGRAQQASTGTDGKA